jgi:predicted DNA-binding protein (MmcQ/YjbR family)
MSDRGVGVGRADIGRICLALPGVTLDHPFGEHHDAYRIGGKMFAIVGDQGELSFKVSEIAYEVLTETGRALPAPYLARAKWVNLPDPAVWSRDDLADHLKAAHAFFVSLPAMMAWAALGLV